MKSLGQTRRRFLRYLATLPAAIWTLSRRAGAASSAFATPIVELASASSSAEAKVVAATRASAVDAQGRPNRTEVAELLSESIIAVTGKADAASAWRSLFGPRDIIGIKVNCLAGPGLSSHPELVAPIVSGLESAGIPHKRIVVWDRMSRELTAAGFTAEAVYKRIAQSA